jgi:oligoribonuclease NrnB/cAMP/cGMP phosphodiesterase (DHH superfamily)
VTTAVIYHDNCPDGWTAAWVAHDTLQHEPGDVTLIPALHGNSPPDLAGVDRLYIVDFSYPPDVLEALAEGGARRVTVLDHHQSALDAWLAAHDGDPDDDDRPLSALDFEDVSTHLHVVFDLERSGAGIAWDYFNTGRPRPPLVDYVEDRDLWRWALPSSKVVGAFIRCQPYTLEAWDELAKVAVDDMASAGFGALAHIVAYCRAAANHAYWCEMGGRRFPIVNVTYESCSEVAAHLLDEFGTDMAGYFFQRGDGRWQYGFRSRGGVTVHDFAGSFGGGGHPQASGCTVDALVHVQVGAK